MSGCCRYPHPSEDNGYLADHVEMLTCSYRYWTGRELISAASGGPASALFHAPFAVVSHDTAQDPIFNYGNRTALELFELPWEAFTRLPSRKSAEPMEREARTAILSAVAENGFVDGYEGIRISSSGRRFMLKGGTIWNLLSQDGRYCGQAAAFSRWRYLSESVSR